VKRKERLTLGRPVSLAGKGACCALAPSWAYICFVTFVTRCAPSFAISHLHWHLLHCMPSN